MIYSGSNHIRCFSILIFAFRSQHVFEATTWTSGVVDSIAYFEAIFLKRQRLEYIPRVGFSLLSVCFTIDIYVPDTVS